MEKLKNERGAILVIAAIGMSVLFTMAALVIDVGLAYCKGSLLQNAADSAVFAGGRFLPTSVEDTEKRNSIISEIEEYLDKNGISEQVIRKIEFTDNINGKYYGVDLSLNTESKTGFARILGIDSIAVSKNAGVIVRPSLSAKEVVPVCVVKDELDELIDQDLTEHIILKYGGGDGTNGAYGAINLSGIKGGGADQYSQWILGGYTTEITIGEKMYPVEPGNMAGPTSNAFNNRYTSCTHFQSDGGCNKEHYEPSCKRVVNVPVAEYVDSKNVRIVGFAVFVLEDCYANDNPGEVQGTYIESVINGTADFTAVEDLQAEYGAYCMTLSH